MEASSVTNKLFEQLNFRGERQKVISSNIANINTPNYKTKELVFEDELNNSISANNLEMKKTDSRHIPSASAYHQMNNSPRLIQMQGLQEQNDGNNVNLDAQMSEMSKNKILFDAIQTAIKKDSRLFRSVIESSAKN